MTTAPLESAAKVVKASWLPLIVIVIAQLQMGININALPVSLGPIVEDLNAPATAVSTALVMYSLFVAAFVMLGAKLGKLFGERLVFQISAVGHGVAMLIMALAQDASAMNTAQIVAGLAAALLVPTLVVLIAANYHGKQQAQALGILASIPAIASGLAFVLAGWIATALNWRYSFGLIFLQSLLVLILSFRLAPVPRQRNIKIDFVGVILSALAIALFLISFNNINKWGLIIANPEAPFNVLGLSPVPVLLIIGLALGQAFFVWSEKREREGKTPLLALEVLNSPEERNAVIAFLVAGGLGSAISFLIPLYIQIVQGQTPLFTSVAIVPYALAVALAAILSVRLYDRFSPRRIGIASFTLNAIGFVLVAATVSNGWGTLPVIIGLIIVGLGEGAMLTLLFNVLVSASPKEYAGDVGALRGVVNNVSSALGAAFAGVVAVGLLTFIASSALSNANLPPQFNLDNLDRVDFVTNAQLESLLATTGATSQQVDEIVRINEEARVAALRAAFLLLALICLLAIVPAARLPRYRPGELDAGEIIDEEGRRKRRAAKAEA
ncbi:MAG: MFS transporter [Anaerolineae bacterium]|jgi:MFS family permease|nr:MFS transporter [Anaerolineae bacterium]